MESNANIFLIMKLLQETTTLTAVSNFLKERKLHYSASSWEQIHSERISPALEKNEICTQDLINLLRTAEEYSRQHVFLYKCLDDNKLAELLNEERVKAVLSRSGLSSILDEPKILDQPELPTIVDVRFDKDVNGLLLALIIKIVEVRISEKLITEQVNEEDDSIINKTYKRISERSVNVIKLRNNGNLELRLASKESKSYRDNVRNIWYLINNIIPEHYFSEIYLNKVKDCLLRDKNELHHLIRFSNAILRNDKGSAVKITTGSQESDLFEDESIKDCTKSFLKYDYTYCETHNIWFLTREGESIPSKEVHVMLSGELNEFSITPHSSEANYEYVINQLRKLNS